jgi:hypothetical protein
MDEPTAADRKELDKPLPGERQTRLSGAWTAIVVGLVAIIVFAFGAARILQLRMVVGRARRKGSSPTAPLE